MIYFLTKNVDKYNFSEVVVTDDEKMCTDILLGLTSMGYDKEATGLNTLLARELLDSWGNHDIQVVVDKTTIPVFGQCIADKFVLHGFNIKYDYTLAKVHGLQIRRVKDAMLAQKRLSLGSGRPNDLAFTYTLRTGKEFPTQKKTRTEFINWPKDKPFEEHQIVYSAYDVQTMPELMQVQDRLINAAGMERLWDIENRLVPVLGDMEIEGFDLDDVNWMILVQENKAKKAKSELRLDRILEQMKPLYPVLNEFTFKRTHYEQGSLFYENKDTGLKTFNYSSSHAVLALFKAASVPIPSIRLKDFKLKKKVLKPSSGEDSLKEYLITYPNTPFRTFIEELLVYKKLEKRLNSFGMRFLASELRTSSKKNKIGYKNPITHKVHTIYRQVDTATARLASGDEANGYYNSQQLPKNNRYRNCFTLTKEELAAGWKVCTLDLSGAEVIIAASLSGEVKVLQMKDIHSELCTPAYRRVINHIKDTYDEKDWIKQTQLLLNSTKFDATEEHASTALKDGSSFEINKKDDFKAEIRDDFKRVVYGLFYGGTAQRISEVLNIPIKWAEIVEQTLRDELPILFKYLDDNSKRAKSEGYVIFNKRTNSRHIFKSYLDAAAYDRPLSRLEASQMERNAKNYPIQGTQADMMKEAMVNVHEWKEEFCKERFKWKLQVHDEIVFAFLGDDIVPKVEEIVTSTCNLYLADGVEMKCAYHIADFWEK